MFNKSAWIPRKMWEQMAITLAVLVTVPLIILGYLLIGSSQTAVKTSVLRDQEQLAIRAAGELGEFIKRPRALLKSTASILGTLHADLWKQETVMTELALNEEIFSRISSLGLDGRELVTSELGTALEDRSHEPAFNKALAGGFYMSDIYISADHTPYATMAAPVRRLGKITGVLIAEVNLRGFWKIVDDIRIGKTGRAYVVSKQGVVIADEDKKRVLANENVSGSEVVRAVLAGRTGSVEFTDAFGHKWLKAYTPIESLGWGVVVKQSTDEAYSFLRLMKVESWVLIGLSLLITLLISVLLARLLVKPIKLLAERMHRVEHGDLDQHLAVQRNDEIGNLMNAFNRMTGQLKKARESEKLAVIGKAAAAIAHELKNSLVMAGTYIGLLPKRHADKEFLEKFSRVLPEELESWKNMLQDISDYSRKSGFELSAVNVNDLVADFTFLIERRLSQNAVRLELDVSENLPAIQGNGQKLKQVLMNLVINALDAMPEGGSLWFAAQVSGAHLEIAVRDTGKGIPKNRLETIFEPFHTTKTNGLGLGLTICREIVEMHGGRLTGQSEVGQGTMFTMTLPVHKTDRALCR